MSSDLNKVVTLTKDGLIVFPTADSGEGSSIRIPQTSTSLGADFGEPIQPEHLLFAATREPVAGFLIYGVSADVVEKWFKVNNLKTETADPDFDNAVQAPLQKLKFKTVLRQLVEYERLYGKALLVGSFSDVSQTSDLLTDRSRGAELLQLVVYPKTQYAIDQTDKDPTSLRFGLPVTYRINNLSGGNWIVHYTRCYEAQTHTNGESILTLIWDDLSCGRNIRWGVGQWIFRVGGGFAVITFPKEIGFGTAPNIITVPVTMEKLREWMATKEFSDISHRTYMSIIDGMKFEFVGAQGATLDPTPFFETNIKQISIATGIPKSILEGAEAGALTGSEKNDQQYYKKISGIQTSFDDAARWVIDVCLDAGLVKGAKTYADTAKSAGSIIKRMLRKVVVHDAKDQETAIEYAIEWNSAFELNALDEARTALVTEQANQTRLEYRTIDEVRELNNLKALPNGEGAKLKTSGNLNLFGEGQKGSPELAANDKFLVVDLNRKRKAEAKAEAEK